MRTGLAAAALVVAFATPAAADPPEHLQSQLQADVGLAVIGIGYERPLSGHFAVMGEAQIFGTYFLPWFDAGDDVKGLGAEVRATFFWHATGRGLYLAAFGRADAVRGGLDGVSSDGYAVSAGGIAGWVFGLSDRIDLRVGAGVQYIYINGGMLDTSTPFATIDLVLGYRF